MSFRGRPATRDPASPEHYFRQYVMAWPIAHSLWRAFECERFAREKLIPPVLDLGCGNGFFAKAVYGKPLDLGVDMDPGEVHRARTLGAYREVLEGDARDLPLKDASIRTVISNCVFEHIPDVERALKEVARVLKSGGRFLFTVPSEYYRKRMLARAFFTRVGLPGIGEWWYKTLNRVFRHFHLSDRQEWARKLKRAGLKLDRAEYIIPIPAYHSWEHWLLPALPARVIRALFGRWLLFPRILSHRLAPAWFRDELRKGTEITEGAGYFFIARKVRS